MEVSKKDWKLFSKKIGSWQEDYMERIIKNYIDFLNSDFPASTKFWDLYEKIKEDKNSPGVILTMRKKKMVFDIVDLINDGVITINDLDEFSDELIENVKSIL